MNCPDIKPTPGPRYQDIAPEPGSGTSDSAARDSLALYFSDGCPYCWYVMQAINRLGLQVEMRDIVRDRTRFAELIQARGRPTVPVLWIQSSDGSVRWMPESRDIIHYLEETHGQD